jgi:hypothetical protein
MIMAPRAGGSIRPPGWCVTASLVQFVTRDLLSFTLKRESQEFKAMTTIQLPDEQAAALEAKAAVEGLTLEAWLGKLAATEAPAAQARPRKGRYNLAELLAQCDPNAPLSAEDRAWLDAPAVGREAL